MYAQALEKCLLPLPGECEQQMTCFPPLRHLNKCPIEITESSARSTAPLAMLNTPISQRCSYSIAAPLSGDCIKKPTGLIAIPKVPFRAVRPDGAVTVPHALKQNAPWVFPKGMALFSLHACAIILRWRRAGRQTHQGVDRAKTDQAGQHENTTMPAVRSQKYR